jgi:hypothetical protein
VALTTECAEGLDTENRRRENKSALTNGITSGEFADQQTIAFLDAIASIAVCERRKQVVAVTFQLDNKSKKIHWTIAQNDNVPESVTDHIKKVWEMLRELSDAKYLKKTGEYEGGFPTLDPTISEVKEFALAEEIYKFSEKKLIARAEKWRRAFSAFARAFIQAFDKGTLDDSTNKELQEDLIFVIAGLFAAFNWGKPSKSKPAPPIQDWNNFIELMGEITDLVDKILENPYACETWMKELKGRLANSRLCTYCQCNV